MESETTMETLEKMSLLEIMQNYDSSDPDLLQLYTDPEVSAHIINTKAPALSVETVEELVLYLKRLYQVYSDDYIRFIDYLDSYDINTMDMQFIYEHNGGYNTEKISVDGSQLVWKDGSWDVQEESWWNLVDGYLKMGYTMAYIYYDGNDISIINKNPFDV